MISFTLSARIELDDEDADIRILARWLQDNDDHLGDVDVTSEEIGQGKRRPDWKKHGDHYMWTSDGLKKGALVYKNHKLSWATVAVLGAFHLLALSALTQQFEWRYLRIMVGMYLWMGFSTTLYLHRMLTHRALEGAGWLKFICFLGTAVGQQGDPVGWVGHHRMHHAKSDKEGDVHSPLDGFLYAHFGWIIRDPGETDELNRSLAKDIREKYWYCRLGENPVLFLLPHVAVAAAFFATLGFGGMAWCLYVPMIAVYHVTWSVNSLCHIFGYRRTETSDQSRNFWPIGLLALGEGWHNNHHACQTRAPQGQAWYEIDLTTCLIWSLEKLRLVKNVRWHAPVRTIATEPVLSPDATANEVS